MFYKTQENVWEMFLKYSEGFHISHLILNIFKKGS